MAHLVIDVLYHYRNAGHYLLHEFVVMRDHLHLLLSLTTDTTIEKAIQFIKGGFSFRAKKELGYTHEVWQRGFSEVRIYDVSDYLARKEYIRLNPVKRGYSVTAEEYPYSSANPRFSTDPEPDFRG